MKFTKNREAMEALDTDMLGYIFYAPSKRYVGEHPEAGLFNSYKPKVGVFVDANAFEILGLAKNFDFTYIQLHGKENPKTCKLLKDQGLRLIKVFPVDEKFKFSSTKAYEGIVDYFLFDTKTRLHGGSGQKFEWKLLENYKGDTPFLLSGGVGPNDAENIKAIQHPKLIGVDLNSGFEDEPGLKNVEQIEQFIKELNE